MRRQGGNNAETLNRNKNRNNVKVTFVKKMIDLMIFLANTQFATLISLEKYEGESAPNWLDDVNNTNGSKNSPNL